MTEQEVKQWLADTNSRLEGAMKRLVTEGYRTGTVAFAMAKIAVTKDLTRLEGIQMPITINIWDLDMPAIIAMFIYKLGFDVAKFGRLLLKLRNLVRVFKPITIHKMDGRKMYFNWMDDKSRYIFEDYLAKDIWEPVTTKLVKEQVKAGDVCIDIGASIGYFTLLFSECVGKTGKVYAFEPTMRGYKYLVKNIKINGYQDIATAYNLGAWDKSEVVGVPRCDDNSKPTQCVSVSEHLAKQGIEKVDFIKMDIDGSEPWALKGLIPTFEKNPQLKIVVEYYPKYITNAGGNPQDVLDILNKYFNVYEIPDDYGSGCWNYYCVRK